MRSIVESVCQKKTDSYVVEVLSSLDFKSLWVEKIRFHGGIIPNRAIKKSAMPAQPYYDDSYAVDGYAAAYENCKEALENIKYIVLSQYIGRVVSNKNLLREAIEKGSEDLISHMKLRIHDISSFIFSMDPEKICLKFYNNTNVISPFLDSHYFATLSSAKKNKCYDIIKEKSEDIYIIGELLGHLSLTSKQKSKEFFDFIVKDETEVAFSRDILSAYASHCIYKNIENMSTEEKLNVLIKISSSSNSDYYSETVSEICEAIILNTSKKEFGFLFPYLNRLGYGNENIEKFK